MRLRAFGPAAELCGFREGELEVPAGTDLAGLRARLAATFPSLSPLVPHLHLALNGRPVQGEALLAEGDEVALLPPVSGGAHPGSEGVGPVAGGAETARGAGIPQGEAETPRGGVDPRLSVRVLPGPLPLVEALSFLLRPDCGGVALFLGVAREESGGGRVLALEYDAYPEMAEASLVEIAREAAGLGARSLLVWHRTGRVLPGEPSVVVGASAPHRAEAFEACRYLIEELKKRAPLWKREVFEGGSAWVGLPPLPSDPPLPSGPPLR